MTSTPIEYFSDYVATINPSGRSSIVLACEHASSYIPDDYNALGLTAEDQSSHAAWDPGALGVAQKLSYLLNAVLVASKASRLLYDCNRPPNATSAMPTRSELIDIPGNKDLTASEKSQRVKLFYEPFREQLHQAMMRRADPILVTVHSFTPVFFGKPRSLKIGVLHDADTRLADAMLDISNEKRDRNIKRNAPYGPEDGVTHTLQEHAIAHGHLNVMLEIRNDLIATDDQQNAMAKMIAKWIDQACVRLGVVEDVQCRA